MCGVRGVYFESVVLVREVLEILIQTIQAYQSSLYSANHLLNITFGVLIVLNCFSSPVVHALNIADSGKHRMLILVIDLVLDVVWFFMPMYLWKQYWGAILSGEAVLYQDTFIVRAVMETQLIFVASYPDLIFKIMPSLSVFFTINKLTLLVRREKVDWHKTAPKEESMMLHPSVLTHQTSLGTIDSSSTTAVPNMWHRLRELFNSSRVRTQMEKVLIRVLVAWGAFASVMLLLPLMVSGKCQDGCLLSVRPWFVYTRCNCAVQAINCYNRGIGGNRTEIGSIFNELERDGLASFIFMHCPRLEIPSEIHWFQDLYSLEVYNSTLVAWGADAAMSASVYYRLGAIFLVRTHLTELPAALLQGDLPPTLREIDVIVSNLTTLPSDLHLKWPYVRTAYFDHGQLGHVPPVLGQMALDSLSLVDNNISVIPDDIFADKYFQYLSLNSNPLTVMPSQLGHLDTMYELQILFTNISTIDDPWLSSHDFPALSFMMYAFHSPICGNSTAAANWPNLDLRRLGNMPSLTLVCRPHYSVYSGIVSYSWYALKGKTEERRIR